MAEELRVLGAPRFDRRGAASDEYIHGFRALWTQDDPVMNGDLRAVLRRPLCAQTGVETAHLGRRRGKGGEAPRRSTGRRLVPPSGATRAPCWTQPSGSPRRSPTCIATPSPPGATPGKSIPPCLSPGTAWETELPRPEGGRLPFTGSAARITEDVEAYAEQGLNHLIIGFESDDLTETLDLIEAFAREVAGGGAEAG